MALGGSGLTFRGQLKIGSSGVVRSTAASSDGDVQTSLTGVEAAMSLGSTTQSGKASHALTGLAATSAIDSVTVRTGAGATVSGLSATSGIGSTTQSGKASHTLSGLLANASIGTATAVGGSGVGYDTFVGLGNGVSIAGATWDTSGKTWRTQTWLQGNGSDAVKSDGVHTIAGNFIEGSGEVGQAIFFDVVAGFPTDVAHVILRVGGDSTLSGGNYEFGVTGISVHVGGFSTMTTVNEIGSANDGGKAYGGLTGGQQYCVEICRTSTPTIYNTRLSNASGGVRGSVIQSSSITLSSARGANDTNVQVQIPLTMANYTNIKRVESLTSPFSLTGGDTFAPSFVSALVADEAPSVVEITFDEALAAFTPATSAFAVTARTVTSVSVSGTKVSLVVSPAVAGSDVLTVTYTKPGSNQLRDAAGNEVASFGPSSVTNNVDVVPINEFDFATTGSTISGPSGMAVEFGATGAAAAVEFVELLYSGMSVGHAGATQSRWRCRPVTVNGVQFNIFPGLDSDGRADVWIYATPSTTNNREYADVSLKIKVSDVYQNLFGEGTTYSYRHQRGCWLRWQSTALTWDLSKTYIDARIADGTFMKHTKNSFAVISEHYESVPPTSTNYKPFKTFTDDERFPQTINCGDLPRSTAGGGERFAVGHCNENYARLIAEVSTDNNAAYVTTARRQVLIDVAEAIGNYPLASALLDPTTKRVIDPATLRICSFKDATETQVTDAGYTFVPQPQKIGLDTGDTVQMKLDARWDNGHAPNKVSYHAYWFSKDPYHLLLLHGHAMALITSGYLVERDGLKVTPSGEERAEWWGLQSLAQAWHSTPSTSMPAPFLNKTFLAGAINNSLQYIRDRFMGTEYWDGWNSAWMTGGVKQAAQYWRPTVFSYFLDVNLSDPAYERAISPFMNDFGHTVLAQILMMGFSNARDVAEWKVVNLQRRVEHGGNYYMYDISKNTTGGIGMAICRQNDAVLGYSNASTFRSWYPRPTAYKQGSMAMNDWYDGPGTSGIHTHIFHGALNAMKECAARGFITLPFDAAAAESTFLSQHSTYTNSGVRWTKNTFGY